MEDECEVENEGENRMYRESQRKFASRLSRDGWLIEVGDAERKGERKIGVKENPGGHNNLPRVY